MQIRPVNPQVMLQQVAQMNRLTNNDGSRAETQQNQFAQEFAKAQDKERTQVVQAQEPDEGQNVNPDGSAGKEKEERNKKKRPGQTDDDNDNENKPPTIGRGILDIRM